MKRVVFGAAIAMAMMSCGGEAEEATEEVVAPEINTEAVMEMENSVSEVEQGMNELEESINELNNDVDSLLDGI